MQEWITIITKLKNHFDLKPLEIAESYKFGSRDQKNGEMIIQFILALNLTITLQFWRLS